MIALTKGTTLHILFKGIERVFLEIFCICILIPKKPASAEMRAGKGSVRLLWCAIASSSRSGSINRKKIRLNINRCIGKRWTNWDNTCFS